MYCEIHKVGGTLYWLVYCLLPLPLWHWFVALVGLRSRLLGQRSGVVDGDFVVHAFEDGEAVAIGLIAMVVLPVPFLLPYLRRPRTRSLHLRKHRLLRPWREREMPGYGRERTALQNAWAALYTFLGAFVYAVVAFADETSDAELAARAPNNSMMRPVPVPAPRSTTCSGCCRRRWPRSASRCRCRQRAR